jgi:acyl-CoA thioesterase
VVYQRIFSRDGTLIATCIQEVSYFYSEYLGGGARIC